MRAYHTVIDEEDSLEDVADVALAKRIKNGENQQYLFRRSRYRKGLDTSRFKVDLQVKQSSMSKITQ
jgi:hypothetical protein